MKSLLRTLPSILFFALALVSCGPRGETKTLDQVFIDAKSSYKASFDRANTSAKGGGSGSTLPHLSEDIKRVLQSVTDSMDELSTAVNPSLIQERSNQVADLLVALSMRAGYTSRPSLGELVMQFEQIAVAKDPNSSQIKLLLARTYTLLGGELNGVQFSL